MDKFKTKWIRRRDGSYKSECGQAHIVRDRAQWRSTVFGQARWDYVLSEAKDRCNRALWCEHMRRHPPTPKEIIAYFLDGADEFPVMPRTRLLYLAFKQWAAQPEISPDVEAALRDYWLMEFIR